MATEGTETLPAAVLAEIKQVVGKAKAGDAAAVPRLRELLDQYPLLWRTCGDIAAQAERAWIDLAAGPNLHLKECLIKFAIEQRVALTRPGAVAMEKLLVDRVVACWLQIQYFTSTEATALKANESPRLLQFRAKRQAQAQKMYEASLNALLSMQKLLPAVQPSATTPGPGLPTPSKTDEWGFDLTGELPNRMQAFFDNLDAKPLDAAGAAR